MDRTLLDCVRAAEALLREHDARRGPLDGRGDGGRAACEDDLAAAIDAMEHAAAQAPDEALVLARRIQRIRAVGALRTREVPGGALEGLYEAVRAGTDGPEARGWDRAGMSLGFLDAPRSLTLWRRTAMAACALLALGAGLATTGPFDAASSGRGGGAPTALHDPRDGLLPRLDGAPGERTGDGAIVPASAGGPTRRMGLPGGWRYVFRVRPDQRWNAGALLDRVNLAPVRVAPAAEVERN